MDRVVEKRIGRPQSAATLAGLHRCWKCRETKALDNFYKDCHKSDGYGFICKPCNKIVRREHWPKYREKLGDEYLKRERARYYRDHEKRLEQNRKSWNKYGAQRNAEQRKRHTENPIRQMLINARGRAKRKGLEFNLTALDISVPAVCPVLGIPLFITPGRVTDNSPSLDRVDNLKGYVRGNVIVVSFRANTIKTSATVEEMRMVAAFYGSLT